MNAKYCPCFGVKIGDGARVAMSITRLPGTRCLLDRSRQRASGSGCSPGIRQSDHQPLADSGGGLLNGLEQHIRIPRVEKPLELTAARAHPLRHFALAD